MSTLQLIQVQIKMQKTLQEQYSESLRVLSNKDKQDNVVVYMIMININAAFQNVAFCYLKFHNTNKSQLKIKHSTIQLFNVNKSHHERRQ